MQVRDPITELHETQLYQHLVSINSGYAERITTFVREVASILATTARHFPYYTRHDAHHGFRVTKRIAQIVRADCFTAGSVNELHPAEIFLLIASSYAHDLGMTAFPGEGFSALGVDPQTDPANPILQEFLRREHSKRGGDYIHKHAEKLGVPLNLVGALDWMMKSHNLQIPELEHKLREQFAADERPLDVKQLSVILCIADAIEFSDTRVVDGVLDQISKDPSDAARVSYRENMKHVCIGDSVAVDQDGRILVSGTFSEPEVLALAHYTLDQMEEWIRGYCDIDRRSSIRRLRIRPEPLIRRLELRGGRFERLGIRIGKRAVIELISSNSVWRSDRGVPMRELIQNAVEACRYRAYHSPPAANYRPEIKVTFDRQSHSIRIADNGCGMSQRVILDHFLTVGNSRAKDSSYTKADYAPIARFGIGFWSVFTLADSARVRTAPFEDIRDGHRLHGSVFEVSIAELKDYTVFSDVEMEAGTEVALHLKADIALDDVFEAVKRLMLCSEISLTLELDGESTKLPTDVPDVTDEALFAARLRLKDEMGIGVFHWRGTSGDTELSMALAHRLEQGRTSFLADPSKSLLTVLESLRTPRTAVCGFSVGARPRSICFDLTRIGSFHANHRSPRGFDFSIDRQHLLPTGASSTFGRDISALIHDGYRAFLQTTGSYNPKNIYELNTQSAMHGGNVFDTFTGSELADAAANYADLLCFRLIRIDAENPSQDSSSYVSLSDLQTMQGEVLVIQNSSHRHRDGSERYFPAENLTPQACAIAHKRLQGGQKIPTFVAEANRQASMLFDAASTSTVEFHEVSGLQVCVQVINLGDVQWHAPPPGILADVQGRWTGAIYGRSFSEPRGKPYVFLGRHRVLVLDGSKLAGRILELKSRSRFSKIAELIALIKEDDAGFTPSEISDLV